MIRRFAAAVVTLILLACSETTEPIVVSAVVVTPATSQLASGAQLQLQVRVLGPNGVALSGRTVSWASSNTSLAQVSQSGLVTGGQNREAQSAQVTITASVDGKSGSTSLEILRVPVTSIEFSASALRLAESDTAEVELTLRAADGTLLSNREVEWSIADTTVLQRLGDGRLLATPYTGDLDRETTLSVSVDEVTASLTARVYVDWDRWTTFWQEMPGAMPDLSEIYSSVDGGTNTSVRLIPGDLNGDGREDLFAHFGVVETGFPDVTTEPIRDRLVLLVSDENAGFIDGTADLVGRVDLRLGFGGEARSDDLNNDGHPDFVVGGNREDGRPSGENSSNWRAPNFALVSSGAGQYTPLFFGDELYSRFVKVLRLDTRTQIFLGPNRKVPDENGNLIGAPEVYQFEGGSFSAVQPEGFPSSAHGVLLTLPTASSPGAPLMVSDSIRHMTLPSLQLSRGVGLERWNRIRTYPMFDGIDTTVVQWRPWATNAEFNPVVVIDRNGRDVFNPVPEMDCVIERAPGRWNVMVGVQSGEIVGGLRGRTHITSDETRPNYEVLSYDVDGEALQRVELLQGQDVQKPFNEISCTDINSDGIPDVWLHSWYELWRLAEPWNAGQPTLYLGDGAGGFFAVPTQRFPVGSPGDLYERSTFLDADGDGIKDLIYFPFLNCGPGESCTRWKLYRGRRQIR